LRVEQEPLVAQRGITEWTVEQSAGGAA
jgi:hypothetical protein